MFSRASACARVKLLVFFLQIIKIISRAKNGFARENVIVRKQSFQRHLFGPGIVGGSAFADAAALASLKDSISHVQYCCSMAVGLTKPK